MLQQLGRSKSGIAERRDAAHQEGRKVADAGFTLIELLIVIVILGILAAVVVFSVKGITDRGKTSACAAEAATITNAAQAYYAKNGSYPATWESMVPDFLATSTVPTGATVTYSSANGVATCTAS